MVIMSIYSGYFYLHGVDATQHLGSMEWVKFLARTVARVSLSANEISPYF